MRPSIVLPRPADRQQIEQFKPWFQQAEEKWWGKFVPYNVRHVHDPEWRNRFWSIQKAHDKRGFWKIVWYAWLLSSVSGTLWSLSLAYKARHDMAVVYKQRMDTETRRWIKETYHK